MSAGDQDWQLALLIQARYADEYEGFVLNLDACCAAARAVREALLGAGQTHAGPELTCPRCQGHNLAADGNTAYCFDCHRHDEQWVFETTSGTGVDENRESSR